VVETSQSHGLVDKSIRIIRRIQNSFSGPVGAGIGFPKLRLILDVASIIRTIRDIAICQHFPRRNAIGELIAELPTIPHNSSCYGLNLLPSATDS
jgi:hypothetical protein